MTDLIVVPKTTEWQRLKALVLDSVSSPITKRVYNLGLDEFFAWYGAGAPARLHQGDRERLAGGAGGPRPRRGFDQRPNHRRPETGSRGGRQRAAGAGTGRRNRPREEREVDRRAHGELAVAEAGAGAAETRRTSPPRRGCATARSSPCCWAAGCGGPRWRRSRWGTSSSVMAAGASSTFSESMGACARCRCLQTQAFVVTARVASSPPMIQRGPKCRALRYRLTTLGITQQGAIQRLSRRVQWAPRIAGNSCEISAVWRQEGFWRPPWGTQPTRRIHVGCIGTGGRAQVLTKALAWIPGVEIAAVCDVWDENLSKGRQLAMPGAFDQQGLSHAAGQQRHRRRSSTTTLSIDRTQKAGYV